MPMPDGRKPKPPLTAVGVAFVAIGLLILVPSGLCAGLLGIGGLSAIVQEGSSSDAVTLLTELVGLLAIPVALGVLLLFLGLRLRKKD